MGQFFNYVKSSACCIDVVIETTSDIGTSLDQGPLFERELDKMADLRKGHLRGCQEITWSHQWKIIFFMSFLCVHLHYTRVVHFKQEFI